MKNINMKIVTLLTVFGLLLAITLSILILPTLNTSAKTAKADEEYSVVIVNPITNKKILPHSSLNVTKADNDLQVTATPGEFEPASFVVSAKQRLENLKLVCSDLRSGHNVLSAENVDIKIVKCWYQGCSSGSLHYTHCPGGPKRILTPELLLHDGNLVLVDTKAKTNYLRVSRGGTVEYIDISREPDNPRNFNPKAKSDADVTMPRNVVFDDSLTLQPISIAPGENQQFWVTVLIPHDTPAGLYEGDISISAVDVHPQTIRLKLNVLPFTLDEPLLEYGLYYRGQLKHEVPERVGFELKTNKELQAEMSDMVKHGVTSCTVTQSYNPSHPQLFVQYLQIMKDAGMKDKLYMLWAGEYFLSPEKTRTLITTAKKLGFREVYFYGGDELRSDQAQTRRESWRRMQSWGGKVFSALEMAAYTVPDVLDLAVVAKIRDPKLAILYHDHGRRIFSYGIPQVGVEEPETYRRSYGLALWKAGYDGVMDYAYQHAWGCIWNDFDGYFRDHVFAYPTSNGLVSTIEWEGFREAVDDVRYLSTLIKYIRKAKDKGIYTDPIEQWLSRIDTNGDLDVLRRNIIDRILLLDNQLRNL